MQRRGANAAKLQTLNGRKENEIHDGKIDEGQTVHKGWPVKLKGSGLPKPNGANADES